MAAPVVELPNYERTLEQAFQLHTHARLHTVEPEQGLVITVLRPNDALINYEGTIHGGALAMLNDVFTKFSIDVKTASGNTSVDLSTSYLAPARSDKMLEMHATCDRFGRRLAFCRIEFWELEDDADGPFPAAGTELRRVKLVCTGRHVKAMTSDADLVMQTPDVVVNQPPYPEVYPWSARATPLAEAASADIPPREALFRAWSHETLCEKGAPTTMGLDTDLRLHSADLSEGRLTFILIASAATCSEEEDRATQHVRAGALAVAADVTTSHAIASVASFDTTSIDLGMTFLAPGRSTHLIAFDATCDRHGRRVSPACSFPSSRFPDFASSRGFVARWRSRDWRFGS
eukprot:COSAG04_NODE_92_length_26689_cov_12.755434_1_plen_347_part_00